MWWCGFSYPVLDAVLGDGCDAVIFIYRNKSCCVAVGLRAVQYIPFLILPLMEICGKCGVSISLCRRRGGGGRGGGGGGGGALY